MEDHATNIHFTLNTRARLVKTTAVLFGTIVVGSLTLALLGHTMPAMHAASDPLREGRTLNAQATKDSAATPISASRQANRPERDFDYFPDHYVNQAMKIEEPISTF